MGNLVAVKGRGCLASSVKCLRACSAEIHVLVFCRTHVILVQSAPGSDITSQNKPTPPSDITRQNKPTVDGQSMGGVSRWMGSVGGWGCHLVSGGVGH